MPLPSFFQRKPKPSGAERPQTTPATTDEGADVQLARARARRRLIGAVVLLGLGVVGFPLLFETAPRPIPVDIPIEIPRKDAVSPLPPPLAAPTLPPRSADGVITEAPADAGTELAPAPAASVPASAPAPAAPAPPPASAPAKGNDGARAKALLEGAASAKGASAATAVVPATPASAAATGRFVVQVGAYTDAATLRETRQKVERLGLKTYTQDVETASGKRTRVRVGPFATREEADAAGRLLKGAGLPANILTL